MNSIFQNLANGAGGTPQVVAFSRVVAKTNAQPLASYAVAADSSFYVAGNVRTISGSTYSFSLIVSWTDETGNAGTRVLPGFTGGFSSGVIANTDGFQVYTLFPMEFRVKGGTVISVAATGTFTSVNYNAEASIIKIA